MTFHIHHGDALRTLQSFKASSVDAIVTDPPCGISFMGKGWDADKGGRDRWIAWLASIMVEAKRVLKPGGHALVWSIPRTSHWTGMAIEDAGLEIRDCIAHFYSSGFPKNHDISKAIDKKKGAARPVIGNATRGQNRVHEYGFKSDFAVTGPGSVESADWEGWGSALKPAFEPWWLCRVPVEESSLADNVLEHGTGAINIDACRIPGEPIVFRNGPGGHGGKNAVMNGGNKANDAAFRSTPKVYDKGRWPTNLVFSHSPDCLEGGACAVDCPVAEVARQGGHSKSRASQRGALHGNVYGGGNGLSGKSSRRGHDDEGTAARFYPRFRYTPKPSTRERESGCEDLALTEVGSNEGGDAGYDDPVSARFRKKARNTHPTVKPIALMRWLCRLITPPGGVVLDPFTGSGTTGCAAVLEGFSFVGVERSSEFIEIARRRIAYWEGRAKPPATSDWRRKKSWNKRK